MSIPRRTFLGAAGAAAVGLNFPARPSALTSGTTAAPLPLVKPPRLKEGDLVGLVNPAGATWQSIDIDIARESFEAMGLKVRLGARVLNRYGSLAGRDEERAADVNDMIRDPAVRAIVCVRGGSGCARILPLVDYDALRRDPKVILGYSDITALHMAIQAKAGVVTFHGPVGISPWNEFSVNALHRLVFDGQAATLENDRTFDHEETIAQRENRTKALTQGTARGRLLGGNLTVLTAIIGSGYVPSFEGAVLFLEDVGEAPYRIDRMMTQLKLAGILATARAVIWGTCSECDPGEGFGSFTIEDVLHDHVSPLGVPAWYGAQFGHIDKQFTIPVGLEAEVDAAAGTIRLLESAVA